MNCSVIPHEYGQNQPTVAMIDKVVHEYSPHPEIQLKSVSSDR